MEQAGPRLAAVLDGLALQDISGVVRIDGNPDGAVYLDNGHITYARASWSPDLSVRLNAALRQDPGQREALAFADSPEHDAGTTLVAAGSLTAAALGDIVRSLVIDAIMVLTMPLAEDASIARIRFEAGKRHWAQAYFRMPVHAARSEAASRAERMASLDLAGATRLELCDLGGSSAVLRPEQWAIVCQMDGATSVRDLAWRCGLAISDTVEQVAGLISAGLCAPCPPGQRAAAGNGPRRPGRRSAKAPRPAPEPAARRAARPRPAAPPPAAAPPAAGRDVTAVRPARRPGASIEDPVSAAAEPGPELPRRAGGAATPAVAPLSADSLKRVLDGLRRLN